MDELIKEFFSVVTHENINLLCNTYKYLCLKENRSLRDELLKDNIEVSLFSLKRTFGRLKKWVFLL